LGEPNIQSYLEKDNSQPVAWMDVDEKGAASGLRYWSEPDNRHEVALYTTPQQSEARGLSQQRTWVGLTDEDYQILRGGVVIRGKPVHWMIEHIETKLKEKNNG
jgi:hypothetical protein